MCITISSQKDHNVIMCHCSYFFPLNVQGTSTHCTYSSIHALLLNCLSPPQIRCFTYISGIQVHLLGGYSQRKLLSPAYSEENDWGYLIFVQLLLNTILKINKHNHLYQEKYPFTVTLPPGIIAMENPFSWQISSKMVGLSIPMLVYQSVVSPLPGVHLARSGLDLFFDHAFIERVLGIGSQVFFHGTRVFPTTYAFLSKKN